MKHLKKFQKFESGPATAPTKPGVRPDTPTKPERPGRRERPGKIERPSVDPKPKAATEEDVINRFIMELENDNDSIENYI